MKLLKRCVWNMTKQNNKDVDLINSLVDFEKENREELRLTFIEENIDNYWKYVKRMKETGVERV